MPLELDLGWGFIAGMARKAGVSSEEKNGRKGAGAGLLP